MQKNISNVGLKSIGACTHQSEHHVKVSHYMDLSTQTPCHGATLGPTQILRL